MDKMAKDLMNHSRTEKYLILQNKLEKKYTKVIEVDLQ